jgi:Rps23 Pro-64 3,4-dihydroxylase Tpa1-like proline 4-hydroxylase
MPEFPFFQFFKDDLLSPHDLEFVKDTVRKADYNIRASDLFNFSQTKELKGSMEKVYKLLHSKYFDDHFIESLEEVCGVPLERRFDTSFQKYGKNDYLLTHDDLLENRAFAYVLYLVDEHWSLDDGGCLALLDCDYRANPRYIVDRIIPKLNRLAIFQVSQKSFHYVEEVLSSTSHRYSLTGWFYTKAANVSLQNSAEMKSLTIPELKELEDESDSWEYIQQQNISGFYQKSFSSRSLPPNMLTNVDERKLVKRWCLYKFKATDYLLDKSITQGCTKYLVVTEDGKRLPSKDIVNKWLDESVSIRIKPTTECDSVVYLMTLFT